MDFHSRKRPAYDASPPLLTQTIKKTRCGLDIKTLSDDQRRTIVQAAAILEVPLAELPDAISAWGNSSARPPSAVIKPRQRFPNRMASGGHEKSFSSLSLLNSSSAGLEKNVEGDLPATGPPDEESSFCGFDNLFRFQKNTGMWADCLASLASPEPTFTESDIYNSGDLHSSTAQFYPASVSADLPLSTQVSSFQNGQLSHPSQIVPMVNEQIPNPDFFACNHSYNSHLLQNYPSLTPDNKQMLRPLVQKQEMNYPDMSIMTASWRQNMGPNIGLGEEFDDQGFASRNLPDDAALFSDEMQESETATDNERAGGSRRGPFRTLYDRAQTAETRKLAACVRCRMQRIRCVPDPLQPHGVCITCRKVSNMKLSKLPCLRYKITEIKLFKPGQVPGMEWTRRWSNNTIDDISTWASKQTKRIQVTEGFCSDPLELEVNRFVAVEGDVLYRKWVAGGVKKQALIPPYAIVDLAAAEQAFKDYINRGGADFFKSVLDHKDKLLWDTYSVAIERANSSETPEQEKLLLKMVLRLWVAIRITTRSIRIAGEETLGMSKDILDETSPLHGSIPIPPVMGAQIELILIQKIQVPLRAKVLDQLQKVILANKSEGWFTIYLCVFILLHNCAMITKHDAGYARKHGIQARFARPAMVAEYHTGANILLAYFHYCNKGLQPFALDGADELASLAGLNERQRRFIKKTRDYAKANESRFEELKWQCAFENDHYFVAQLFEAEWKPRSTI